MAHQTQQPDKCGYPLRQHPALTLQSIPSSERITGNSIKLDTSITSLEENDLAEYIRLSALKRFDQEPKPLQVKSVKSLVARRHTFLLAGMGYGKSRIPEMYHSLFVQSKKPVVLVLNPLDSVGDNQVFFLLPYFCWWLGSM